jgi:hypothetical protein
VIGNDADSALPAAAGARNLRHPRIPVMARPACPG